MALSKSQIDRLGDRLKTAQPTDDDLRLLDEYRRSFAEAYDHVMAKIRDTGRQDSTGRRAKSTKSIVDKLRRESVRLSQVQDIAGCRIIVDDLDAQDRITAALTQLFEGAHVTDRRQEPSHGYRAVHVIIRSSDHPVEVQVRTQLQHMWAELSEKMSDALGIALKYGGGPEAASSILTRLSEVVTKQEEVERRARTSAAALRTLIRTAIDKIDKLQ
jgi:ppGpp synthetase/RelA/SpoT-type nucleotidyltranferase